MPLYDKIRFVILLGDTVYEGPSPREWEAIGNALAGRGPDRTSYPFLKTLARDKPFFPVLGNHELLSFRPYPQRRSTDLFDSAKGVANFKKFFDWDRLIADSHILAPVPSDLPGDVFAKVLSALQDPAERRSLTESYRRKQDGRYHLQFYEKPPLREAEFAAGREHLAAELAPLFQKAGYGTLPVLNSDSMICYAFEAGNVVYLFLDSMSRGLHYPVFARLKRALYPDKKDQHRLNLFSLSPFNGQADFYRAVASYAREHGKTLVPMMHHSIFNSSRDIYSIGVEYNVWLALGLPQTLQEKGDPTVFDDLVFSDVPFTFSACVHAYEHFTLVAKSPGRPDHALQWYVSGGGGGPLRTVFPPERNKQVAKLYNEKLQSLAGPGPAPSVEIRDDTPRVGHHYLIIHVKNGQIVEVSPRFIDQGEPKPPRPSPHLTLTTSYSTRPSTSGAALEFSPGAWGMEKLDGHLTFMDWSPSMSLGFVDYNLWGRGLGVQAYAARLELSPLNLVCHLPRSNIVILRLPGFEVWDGRSNLRRYFVTMGLEAPLLFDLFGKLENLNVGVKAYIPISPGANYDPGFGSRIRWGFVAGYRFRL
jgi:hypothetical protein